MNIAAVAGAKYLQPYTVVEYGSSYYCLQRIEAGPTNPNVPSIKAAAYFLLKINKVTNHVTQAVKVYGDTVQADSIVIPLQQRMAVAQGKIYIVCNKVYYPNVQPIQGFISTRYVQLDTNLNFIVNERPIEFSNYFRTLNIVGSQRFLLSGWNAGPAYTYSIYNLFSNVGDSVSSDTFAVKPLPTNTTNHYVNDVVSYPQNRLLITGFLLPNYQRGFYISDTNLQVVDTYALKPDPITFGSISGRYRNFPFMIAIPTGSIISAGVFEYSGGVHTLICKHTQATRFGTDVIRFFDTVDHNDQFHSMDFSIGNVIYNPTDNYIYYSDATNKSLTVGSCNTSYNYVEIIKLDTNLTVSWRRYVRYATDLCVRMMKATTPDGRSGVILSGSVINRTNFSDTSLSYDYIYYIDSSGTALNTPNIPGNFEVRDRIAVYPNPTTESLTIDDLKGTIVSIELFDAMGRLVLFDNGHSQTVKVNITHLPSQVYSLRVHTNDGFVQWKKVLKL